MRKLLGDGAIDSACDSWPPGHLDWIGVITAGNRMAPSFLTKEVYMTSSLIPLVDVLSDFDGTLRFIMAVERGGSSTLERHSAIGGEYRGLGHE